MSTPQKAAAAAFDYAGAMEDPIATVKDILSALAMIAETLGEDDAAGPIQRLAWLGHDQIVKAEELRGQIFHATHSSKFGVAA